MPQAATPADWVKSACIGESSLYVAPAPVDRVIYGFVVDHVLVEDNTGAIHVNFDASAAIATEPMSWGSAKAYYR